MTELSPAQLAAEIHHFIRGYQQIRGLDPEFVYRIHAGSEREAALRISRLQQIAEYLKRLQKLERQGDGFGTRANGGRVPDGIPYLVGERGPEA